MGIERTLYFFGETPLEGASHIPLLTTRFIDPHCDLSNYDYIIVTSKRSIQAMNSFGYDLKAIPIYCIGAMTAQYANKQDLHIVHISKGYAKDLISEIKHMIKGQKGLYLRPKTVANSYMTNEIENGCLEQAICYETLCIEHTDKSIIRPATFLFAAPSQVNCFIKHFSFDTRDKVVAIGETTLECIPDTVMSVISDEPNLRSLVEKGHVLK